MSSADTPVGHAPLLAVLERARRLGFLGPGPVEDHVRHAAGFLAALADTSGIVIDLGSGGGIPGLVIAVARPELQVVLVDATAKRCRFLDEACQQLGLSAEVVEMRAEELGRGPRRGTADAVTARSFGPPAVTAECSAPLLRVGGILVVSEPPDPTPARWPAGPLADLGMEIGYRSATSPVFQVLRQVDRSPAAFPRGVGVPAKRRLF